MAWTVKKQEMELMQSLGYLPMQAKQVVGDFFHHGGNEQLSASELKDRIALTEAVALECGGVPDDVKEKLNGLKNDTERLRIEQELKIIEDKLKKGDGHGTDIAEKNQPSES